MADSNVTVSTVDLPGSTIDIENVELPVIVTESTGLTGSTESTGPTGPTESSNETRTTVIVSSNNNIEPVETNVVSKFNLEKYLTFVTNDDIKQVVITLTNDSSAVQDIINMIDLILSDGKIDLGDAPILLALVKKIITLRTSDLKLSSKLTLEHFLSIIKLVLTILAKEGTLKIANTDEFIKDINKVISLIENGEQITRSIPCCTPIISWFISSKK
jgi:hypothetical protein